MDSVWPSFGDRSDAFISNPNMPFLWLAFTQPQKSAGTLSICTERLYRYVGCHKSIFVAQAHCFPSNQRHS